MEFQQPNGDGQPYPPQILHFVPKQLLGITPYHNITDGWIYGNNITGDNHNFSTQWLECIYPISGTYAATPRLIYYVFLLVPFVPRIPWLRKSWLREAALTLVMTYSSTTAIHALILVSTWKRMAPDGMLDAEKHEIVQVQGSWTGTYQTSTNLSYHQNSVTLADGTRQLNDHLWMPLLPMVRDHDADPVLSILGSAFLLFLPLQIWSRTMQEPRFRFLWPAWGVILLIGFVSALVYEDLTIFWNMWQLRFCPGTAPNDKDLLPFANTRDDYSMFGGQWDSSDRYRWNKIVGDTFVFHNSTTLHFPNRCIYPCFGVNSWPLRDPTDIWARRNSAQFRYTRGTGNAFLAVYVLTFVYSALYTILYVLSSRLGVYQKYDYEMDEAKEDWKTQGIMKRLRSRGFVGWRLLAITLTAVLSSLIWVFFVGYFEWRIFTLDNTGRESMRHIGQWGFLVTTMLGVVAAGLIKLGEHRENTTSWLAYKLITRLIKPT